ncbi:MAG: hypothetical protein AAGE52_40965 [Myxococcota bacterium]
MTPRGADCHEEPAVVRLVARGHRALACSAIQHFGTLALNREFGMRFRGDEVRKRRVGVTIQEVHLSDPTHHL